VWWMYYVYNAPNYSYYLVAQTTTPDGTWQMFPQNIDSAYSTSRYLSGYATLGMDSAGNGMLVHSVADATTNLAQLYYSKYVATTGEWSYPAELPGAAGLDPYTAIDVALDGTGTAMVAWINNVPPYDLMASRYTKAKGFSTPVPIDDPDVDAAPQILQQGSLTYDGTDFVLGWRQAVDSTYNVYSSRYSTAGAAWSPAELLSDGSISIYGMPMLVSDPHGNSMIAWVQTSTVVQFARWRKDGGAWDTGVVVDGATTDPTHTFNSYSTSIAISANGIVNLVTTEGEYGKAEPLLNVFQ
jgi:hypothetical protein